MAIAKHTFLSETVRQANRTNTVRTIRHLTCGWRAALGRWQPPLLHYGEGKHGNDILHVIRLCPHHLRYLCYL